MGDTPRDAPRPAAADAGAMRAIWSGVIQFGMVALPVRLYGATEEHAVRLHEIHAADGSRVEHRRFCRAENREIPYDEVCARPSTRSVSPYYAGPAGPGAERPHALLVEALARTGVLIVQALLWEDELREPGDLADWYPTLR